MQAVLGDMFGQFALVYLDDIVVYSCIPEQHKDRLHHIFDVLEENGHQRTLGDATVTKGDIRAIIHLIFAILKNYRQ